MVFFCPLQLIFWINNPRHSPPFFDLIDTTVYLFHRIHSCPDLLFPELKKYSCSNQKDNNKRVSFSRKAIVSWSDQQLQALGSFSSLSVGSQLRLTQEVLKTVCSVWGVKRWKKGCVITFCNLTPVSAFWICSHPLMRLQQGSLSLCNFTLKPMVSLHWLEKTLNLKLFLRRYVSICQASFWLGLFLIKNLSFR